MVNLKHFWLFGLIVSGFCGIAPAMIFEPFPICTETSKVDSSLEVVQKDASLNPDSAPYLGRSTAEYYPGTCHLKRFVQEPYYLPGQTFVVEYTPRTTPGTYDFIWKTVPDDRDQISGTVYYSLRGEEDSSLYRYIVRADSGTLDTSYSKSLHITGPDYQLIQALLSKDGKSWEFIWGDSILSGPDGKSVYTLINGKVSETQCGFESGTYVCAESPSSNGTAPRKSIWFLTQGRKDSVQIWENGDLISTEKYFWSAKSAGIKIPRLHPHAPSAATVRRDFDIMGRTMLDRKKAWLPLRY